MSPKPARPSRRTKRAVANALMGWYPDVNVELVTDYAPLDTKKAASQRFVRIHLDVRIPEGDGDDRWNELAKALTERKLAKARTLVVGLMSGTTTRRTARARNLAKAALKP